MTCPSCHGTRRVLLFTSWAACLDCPAAPVDRWEPLRRFVERVNDLSTPILVTITDLVELAHVTEACGGDPVVSFPFNACRLARVCVIVVDHAPRNRVEDVLRGRIFAAAFLSPGTPPWLRDLAFQQTRIAPMHIEALS